MFPIIQIGPLSLQTPGLILLIGVWIGLLVAEKLSVHFHLPGGQLYDLVFIGLVAGLIGARLSYALQAPGFLTNTPRNLFSLTPTMLDPAGGAAAALIAMLIYGNRKSIPLWPALDALAPFLAVLGIAFGFSHLASGRAYGNPADLPWGIQLWGAKRHPTQVYEILLGAGILFVVWVKAREYGARAGKVFTSFVGLTAASQLFIHGFRGDSTFIGPGIRLEQVIAWVLLAVSCFWMRKYTSKSSPGETHAAS